MKRFAAASRNKSNTTGSNTTKSNTNKSSMKYTDPNVGPQSLLGNSITLKSHQKLPLSRQSSVANPYDFLPEGGKGPYKNHLPHSEPRGAPQTNFFSQVKTDMQEAIERSIAEEIRSAEEDAAVLEAKKRSGKSHSKSRGEPQTDFLSQGKSDMEKAVELSLVEEFRSTKEDADVVKAMQRSLEEASTARKKGDVLKASHVQLNPTIDSSGHVVSLASYRRAAVALEESRPQTHFVFAKDTVAAKALATSSIPNPDLVKVNTMIEELEKGLRKAIFESENWNSQVTLITERLTAIKIRKGQVEAALKKQRKEAEAAALKKQQEEEEAAAALKKQQQEEEAAALAFFKAEEAKALALKKAEALALKKAEEALALKKAEALALEKLEESFANLDTDITKQIRLASEKAMDAVKAQDFVAVGEIAQTTAELKKLLAKVQKAEISAQNLDTLTKVFQGFQKF